MDALSSGASGHGELTAYTGAFERSWVYKELYQVRNVKPGLEWGTFLGTLHGGVHMWLNSIGMGFLVPWTLRHREADHEALRPSSECSVIEYPKPDGVITFDRLSSIFISNTNHEEDQPVHLKLRDPSIWKTINWDRFHSPESRYCPAAVYEAVGSEVDGNLQGGADQGSTASSSGREDGAADVHLVINAQNCIHCKTCDVKDPLQNIDWVAPEGGGGPNYPNM